MPERVEILYEVSRVEIFNETTLIDARAVGVEIVQVAMQGDPGPPGAAGSGLANVEDDTSPSLGGNLVLNSHVIVGTLETNLLILDGGLI